MVPSRGTHGRIRPTVLCERVCPPEPGKPREVAIRCADRSAMFERDCGEDGVNDQRTRSLAVEHKTARDILVPFARVENPGGRLVEPGGNRRFGFGRGKRTFEHAGICCNPEEGPQCKPSEADEIGPREHSFEPGSAFLVLLRPRMVGLEEQVRVDENHRRTEPSTCSMSTAILCREIPGLRLPRTRAVNPKT